MYEELEAKRLLVAAEEKLVKREAQLAEAEAENAEMRLEIKALREELARAEARANSMDALMAELLDRGAQAGASQPPASVLAATLRAEGISAAAGRSSLVCCSPSPGTA